MVEASHEKALAGRTDLQVFGNNARLLFALESRFGLDDILTIASNSLTDGHDDKKCDLVYVDRDSGTAIIAQGYECGTEKASAPANKAADLNVAVGWLLSRPISELPLRLQSAATELRSALTDKDIQVIEVWYVHNLPESTNVSNELRTVEQSLKSGLAQHFAKAEVEELRAVEVGSSTLEEWYQALEAAILVTDPFEFNVAGALEMSGDNWSALVTAVPARWLHSLWNEHKSRLFSANVRDYLGSRRSVKNVNHNIKETATETPGQFWAYNNGITALVNDFSYKNKVLSLSGISIVNGAQTTGALGSMKEPPAESAFVPARFVKCTDGNTIQEIIKFNNTQNAVAVTDFRSRDKVQTRLRSEFEQIPNATYTGGRRGSDADQIKRSANLLPADTCSQALAVFHREPALAYNSKSELWGDTWYPRFFHDDTTARHIVFCFSLLRSVEGKKQELSQKTALTASEKVQSDFLRYRGATFLFSSAVASCIEGFLGRAVPNRSRLSFGNVSPDTARLYWEPIVTSTLPFCGQLVSAIESGLKGKAKIDAAVSQFLAMVDATKTVNDQIYKKFADSVVEA